MLLLFKKKRLFTLLKTFVCVTSLTALASKSSAIEFSEVIINSPYKLTQEIIAADVLASKGKELLTFSVDEQSNRWLIIYQLNHDTNQYVIAEKTIIPKQFYRFDLSEQKYDKKDIKQKLYFQSADSLTLYQNKQFTLLANIESLYIQDQADFLSRGDFIQDLNNDAFADVIIADFNNTHILIGQEKGGFVSQVLPIKPEVRVFSSGASYTQAKLYFNDVNFDDKTDILLVGDGEMIIYAQIEQSLFAPTAIHLPINEAISGTEWWNKRDESGEQLDQSDLEYRKLEELRDVNADGIVDIDNDDKLEVLLAGFDIGLSQIIGALITGGIDQDVYVFKMNAQDKFPAKPTIQKDVELTFSLSSGQSGSAVVKLADLNGDGLKELILSDDDDELKIYLGKTASKSKKSSKHNKSFKKRSVSYSTQLPKDGNLVMVEDLNGDGKDDLLMKYSRLDGEDKAKEFKVLFSK